MHEIGNEHEEHRLLWTTSDGNYHFVFGMTGYLQNCNYLGLAGIGGLGVTY